MAPRSLPRLRRWVAFWALAEIVKAQAGILERDTETEAAEKLRAAVEDAFADASDARWVESHLRPLVGLETETGLGGATAAAKPSRPGGASWGRSPSNDRSCSCSRICTGPTLARLRRRARRLAERGPSPRRLQREAGVAPAPSGLGRREAQRLRPSGSPRSRKSRQPS